MEPSEQIDQYIAGLCDWQRDMLTRIRALVHAADPAIVEEWKWMGSPVWSDDGIVVVGMAFKDSIKLGFMQGASLPDPDGLFNDELAGKQRRAIKYHEGDTIDETALANLIRTTVAYNHAKKAKK
ncbi:MAG: DUF1801 domain-containing protein [Anaerolineae bacterium]